MGFGIDEIFAYCGGDVSNALLPNTDWDWCMANFRPDCLSFLTESVWHTARIQTGCPQEMDAPLGRIAEAVLHDEKLARMFWFVYATHVYPLGKLKARIGKCPMPAPLGDDKDLFYFLIAMCMVPHIWDNHRSHGVPADITLNTLQKYHEHAQWFLDCEGKIGLNVERLNWLSHYIHAPLYRLDRLEFWPQPSALPYSAWKRKSDGTMIVFPNDGLVFTDKGYQFNDVDPQDCITWKAVYKEENGIVSGTPFSPRGIALNRIVTLKTDEWENVYRSGDMVAAMHIPYGGGLTPERTQKSFAAVRPFFEKYYPELPFRMIQCVSWIMGNQLEDILKPNANLLNLQHNVYLMPHSSARYHGLSFLFPKLDEANPDLASQPRDNSIRRAIMEFLDKGGRWRAGGMFFDTNDIAEFGQQPYLSRWDKAKL